MAIVRCSVMFILLCSTVHTAKRVKRAKLCVTPNNLDGKCQTLNSCEIILHALASGDPQAADFARESTNNCGFAEDHFTPLVCCGAYGTFAHLVSSTAETYTGHKQQASSTYPPIQQQHITKPYTVSVNTLTLGPTPAKESDNNKYTSTTVTSYRHPVELYKTTTPSYYPPPFTSKTESTTKKYKQRPSSASVISSNGHSFQATIQKPVAVTDDIQQIPVQDLVLNGVDITSDLFPLLPNRKICGRQIENKHLYNGDVALPGEYPWLALLRYNDKFGRDVGFHCAGTLINRRYILTAAHCVAGSVNQDMDIASVRLGEQNQMKDPDCYATNLGRICADRVLDLNISEVISHPTYHTVTGNNDIALLRLVREVPYSDFIQPICLPPQNHTAPRDGEPLVVAGWGVTVNGTSGSSYKRAVKLPIVAVLKCKEKLERYRTNAWISGNQICAGGVQGVDACKGDSGGPLMNTFRDEVDGYKQWYQEAVVSWGVGCGTAGYPGVYTRISRYLRWISNMMQT